MYQDSFHSGGISTLYPAFKNHIQKLYSLWVETWALYSRIERQLPTRGSNAIWYQFGRVKTINLVELLHVTCNLCNKVN